jgi:hypothetical protein
MQTYFVDGAGGTADKEPVYSEVRLPSPYWSRWLYGGLVQALGLAVELPPAGVTLQQLWRVE